MLNLAIVGLKGHYSVFLDGLADLPDARLVAVSDEDPVALQAVRDWPGSGPDTRLYDSWEAMLRCEEVDIVLENGVDSDRHRVVIAAA